MKSAIYFFYYISKLDRSKFCSFLSFVHLKYNFSKTRLLADLIYSSLRYKISILEYFQFGFYNLGREERNTYAGTGYMYEYQRIMNPVKERVILDDKRLFYRKFRHFVRHTVADLDDLKQNQDLVDSLISNPGGRIVFKVFNGKCGQQVSFHYCNELTAEVLLDFMKEHGYDLAEEFIIQHPIMSQLSPSAVNTVRIFTQLNSKDEVEILGCRLRISVDSPVDNMAAGNIAASINEATGIIDGPGVYSDISRPDETVHPITGTQIIGFQVPFWAETIKMVKEAAKQHPQNRSIGWDIAITNKGPDLIEGNHDWCKLVWQLPVKHGLKPVLERHLGEYLKNKRK